MTGFSLWKYKSMAIQKHMFFSFMAGWLLFFALVCAVLLLHLPFDIQSDILLYVFDVFLVLVVIFYFVGKKIYRTLNAEQKNFLKQGALLAALNALIGNLIFVIIDTATLLFNIGLDDLVSHSFILLIVVIATSLFAAFPALIFGQILAFALLQNLLHGSFSIKSSLIKGAMLGSTLGISLCLFTLILLGYHVSFTIWLQRTIIVSFLAGLAGGWTGWKLGKFIIQFHSTFPEPNEIRNEQQSAY